MTEFEITEESVGRVAIALDDREWTILAATGGLAFATDGDSHAIFNRHGEVDWDGGGEAYSLERWKPKTLVAPKMWWNVYQHDDGSYWAGDGWDDYEDALSVSRDCVGLVARVFAEHWHGCEEGRFDIPGGVAA